MHVRSPELFHDIVQGDKNGTKVAHPIHIPRPCAYAGGYFIEYLKLELWKGVCPQQLMG